jgi:acetylornithine deacetylase/succinyl-diaminopimelate desuccinylase-like protein
VISRLHKLDRDVFTAIPSAMNGRTVFHTGTIAGGTDYAPYPNRATLGIEIGTQPGEHLSDRVAEIEGIFAEIAADEPGFSGEVAVRLDRDPFRAQGHERLQEVLTTAMERVLGHPPKVTGMNAWTDAALMQAAGIPTLLIGATGANYHAPDEWISVSELVKLCAILEQAIAAFLG